MDKIELKIRHRNCRIHLIIESKITVIVGCSATGKSTIHRVLTHGDQLTQFKVIGGTYEVDHLVSNSYIDRTIDSKGKLRKNSIYIIDEGAVDIDDNVAGIIQRSTNCYFIITARTKLGKLNFDIKDVKELDTKDSGITVLKNYIITNKKSKQDIENVQLDKVVIEDSGKAKTWFEYLLCNLNINIEAPDSKGKEQVCNTVIDSLSKGKRSILMIFDSCSFGVCAEQFKGLIEKYPKNIMILANYKSWEYLILKSNIYKNEFVEYSLNTSIFEEQYYERLLYSLSMNNKKGVISHSSGSSLPKCYTHECCAYSKDTKRTCNIGLSGEDKFVEMLRDTIFEDLLVLARRI